MADDHNMISNDDDDDDDDDDDKHQLVINYDIDYLPESICLGWMAVRTILVNQVCSKSEL